MHGKALERWGNKENKPQHGRGSRGRRRKSNGLSVQQAEIRNKGEGTGGRSHAELRPVKSTIRKREKASNSVSKDETSGMDVKGTSG